MLICVNLIQIVVCSFNTINLDEISFSGPKFHGSFIINNLLRLTHSLLFILLLCSEKREVTMLNVLDKTHILHNNGF